MMARLGRTAVRGTLSHAYIIEAPSEELGRTAAFGLAKLVLCREPREEGACGVCLSCRKMNHGNHEDLLVVEPEGSGIKVEAIKELQARLKNRPYGGDRNLGLIYRADLMNPTAQNKLLKTLEEPPGRAVIILVVQNAESLLLTIRSRCILCRITEEESEGRNPELDAAALACGKLLKAGKPFWQAAAAMKPALGSGEDARYFLDALEDLYRELPLTRSQVSRIEEARRRLDRGIRVDYALKDMLLKILAGDSLPTGGFYD